MKIWRLSAFTFMTLLVGCATTPEVQYDLVIRNAVIYDGSGGEPISGSVAVDDDRIVLVGEVQARGTRELDVEGMAVAPGFVNMLSWAVVSAIEDGRAQSDLRQGVTLEVFGEGSSMGPLNEAMKQEMRESQGDIRFDVEWTTLSEYLEYLVNRGVSPNVASFVGAETVRVHVLGQNDRAPSQEELAQMQDLVRTAMQEGAMGLGSSLIYAPGVYASTEELIALAKVVAEYEGVHISHLRSEGDRLIEAVEEFLRIAREAGVRSEIYHLKASGQRNWNKLEQVIEMVERARSEGMEITADMYTYTAGATGLDASMPPWVQEGGTKEWIARMKDPAIRRRVAREIAQPDPEWENLYQAAGSAERLLLVGFKNPDLKHLTGKTLAEVAGERGTSPEETMIDLVIEDGSRVGTIYFMMSEENVAREVALPWMSFGSDAGAPATEGNFLKSNPHPRAYGNFARLLAKYVRQDKVISLAEAVRRLSALPCETLRIQDRGLLQPGFYADLVVFDPDKVEDMATFPEPHQYARGVVHVFVNGIQALENGEPTGASSGRVVRGPGWTGD